MKALLFGAVLALLWLAFGVPLAAVAATVSVLAQPVTIAFAAGLAARPYLARGRTA
ncbi:hypothetical protein P1P68_12655 [Streptomyces scabiei]|uniref:hypothetical protein n=1 Tax=Streptomyces scabiei TaxID=1930 RepID=UPI002990256A|nr:hypothetical protein [Streptomyces scabiei]MDW8805609.1 hypothetical protein [Streptomyces scabiei]